MSPHLALIPRRRRPAPPRPAPALRAVIRRARIRIVGSTTLETYLPGWDWRVYRDNAPADHGHASTWLAARAQALDALEHWSHAA